MEGEGKDFSKGPLFEAVVAGERDDGLWCDELRQDLAARSAWRAWSSIQVCNCDGHDFVSCAALGDSVEQGIALRTDRQPIGNILNVAASCDKSIIEEQRSADSKARVRRVSVFGCFASGRLKLLDVAARGPRIWHGALRLRDGGALGNPESVSSSLAFLPINAGWTT